MGPLQGEKLIIWFGTQTDWFRVQGSKFKGYCRVGSAHHIDQDPEYPTYPFGYSSFINMTKTKFLWYELLLGKSTLNVEP
jgi:hypothetical protein